MSVELSGKGIALLCTNPRSPISDILVLSPVCLCIVVGMEGGRVVELESTDTLYAHAIAHTPARTHPIEKRCVCGWGNGWIDGEH